MVVIAHSPHAERLGYGGGSLVVQGKVFWCLDKEERPHKSEGLQRAGHIEMVRSGTELMVRERGKAWRRSVTSPVDRGEWGWAY
jgi:hypothetical protein